MGGQAERTPASGIPSTRSTHTFSRQDDRPGEPSVGSRHSLYPDAARIFVPGRDHRLGHPKGVSYRLSDTLAAGFCVEALSEALARFGKPGIFDPDQEACMQFTSDEFTRCCGVTESRSAWMDAGAATTTSSSSVGPPLCSFADKRSVGPNSELSRRILVTA